MKMGGYGAKPVDLGRVDISPSEMMFWLYCPIKLPKGDYVIPDNLCQFKPIISEVNEAVDVTDMHVYITAKTLWVTQENAGNRRGWHSDGFMTDDLNFIWSDTKGTLFWEPSETVSFTQDHSASLSEMEAVAEAGPHAVYPDKHLLLLDETVIHRVADFDSPGMRTFVKVSVSRHQYRLKGNSINHALCPDWEYIERRVERNAPETPSSLPTEGEAR